MQKKVISNCANLILILWGKCMLIAFKIRALFIRTDPYLPDLSYMYTLREGGWKLVENIEIEMAAFLNHNNSSGITWKS